MLVYSTSDFRMENWRNGRREFGNKLITHVLRVDIPTDFFDDLNLAIDNTWHLSNAKTIV